MTDSLKTIDLNLPHWVGAAELEHTPQGIKPWRLPVKMLDFLEARTRFQAGNPSGVRLRFATTSRVVELAVLPEPKESRWFDLLSDDTLLGRVELASGQAIVRFEDLPAGDKTLELWLNHMYSPVVVGAIRIEAGAAASQVPLSNRQRILYYGSSISHGRKADGPSESWTMGAARMAKLDPVNLGVGGACTLETAVARFIRDSQADYFNFCLGVNMMMGATHAPRVFRSAAIGLLQLVREKHPQTPIAVQSPIFIQGQAEHTPNAVGMSMQSCREQVREVVQTFIAHGDRHIVYTDGLELFNADDAHLLIDGVHPSGQGQRLMSQRWHDIVWPQLRTLASPRHDSGERI